MTKISDLQRDCLASMALELVADVFAEPGAEERFRAWQRERAEREGDAGNES